MGYVISTGGTALASKEKALKLSRGRNVDWVITKPYTHLGLVVIQILCEN